MGATTVTRALPPLPVILRGRRAEMYAEKSVRKIDGANLLEFEKLDERAGKRLSDDVREALLDAAVGSRERVAELDARDVHSGMFDAKLLNLRVGDRRGREGVRDARMHSAGFEQRLKRVRHFIEQTAAARARCRRRVGQRA